MMVPYCIFAFYADSHTKAFSLLNIIGHTYLNLLLSADKDDLI